MKPAAVFAVVSGLLLGGCMPDRACTPGAQQACACPGGGMGAQICKDDGSGFLACFGCPTTGDLGPTADGSVLDGAPGDLTSNPDLSPKGDLAMILDASVPDLTMPDLSSATDLAAVADAGVSDLEQSLPDLSIPLDLSRPADLSSPPDLRVPRDFSGNDFSMTGGFVALTYDSVFSNNVLYAGDYDRDGDVDLLTVRSGDFDGHVWLGNGDGTFHAGSTVVGLASLVYQSDLNGDGIVDLVDSQSHVFLGNGDGTFQSGATITWPTKATTCGTGDFNRDGKLDLVSMYNDASPYTYLDLALGNGDGTFQAPQKSTLIPQYAAGACVAGDFNGDGITDVEARLADVGGNLYVFFGDGKAGFTIGESLYTSGGRSTPSVVADFDKNGMMDVVSEGADARYIDDTIEVSLNGHVASSTVVYIFSQTINAFGPIAAGDLNGDGNRDIVGASGYFLGNGDGTFQALTPVAGVGTSAFAVSADFNLDGKDDIALSDASDGTITILLSNL